MAFDVAVLWFYLEPEGEGPAPGTYLGSAIRGGFGRSLRRTVCVTHLRDCHPCPLQPRCPYVYLFETPGAEKAGSFHLDRAPHPLVICPPGPEEPVHDLLAVRTVLIGPAVNYLPHVIWAFHSLGLSGLGAQRSPYILRSVEVDGGGKPSTLWEASNPVLLKAGYRPVRIGDESAQPTPASRVRLRFCTPLRIRFQRRLCTRLTFPVLMTNVLRRLHLLDQVHGDGGWRFDHAELIRAAESVRCTAYELRWHDWTRYSSRQNTKMQLGGLLGTVTFEGDLGPFMPYLRAAELVHVGRNTSFGLGRMVIEEVH